MKKFNNDIDGIQELYKYIINKIGNIQNYKIVNYDFISAIFLAGAPGAGKTEFLDTILTDLKSNFIIIDIDKYRNYFHGYNGENSSEYQNSSVKVADKILKYCFKNNLNFVFDGTFRNYNKVQQNFGQCKKFNRKSLITLIYQEPRISFYYTFLRKLKKKRNVPIEVFIDGFYYSIFNVFKAYKDFESLEIMIAHKKYNQLNKNKSTFKIDYNTNSLNKFCKKYRILYENNQFKNRDYLMLDLKKFQDILQSEFYGSGTILGKLKIWFREKIWKSF